MLEISLIDKMTEVGVPIHVAKNEHVTELPVLGSVRAVSCADRHTILTHVRCHECW